MNTTQFSLCRSIRSIAFGTSALTFLLIATLMSCGSSRDAGDIQSVGNGKTTDNISSSGHDLTPIDDEAADEMARALGDDLTFKVTREEDTEYPRTGKYWDNKKDGIYLCRVCGLPLYSSETKFVSGTGWPSFWQEVDKAHVGTKVDHKLGSARTELHCARCESHLGHVFNDAHDTPTGLRHCINSVSLEFVEKDAPLPDRSKPVVAPK